MKKHHVFSTLFILAAIVAVDAQSLVYSGAQTPTVAVQKVRQLAEQHLGVLDSRVYDNDRDDCGCDRCQKQKKSKKHDDCNQKGNHYGKHKNKQNKHSCSCDHNRCESGNRRDHEDDERYGSTRRDRDDDGRQQPQAGQRKPTPKVKSRPVPTTTKPTSTTRPAAKRKVTTRPVGTRQ